MTSPIRVPAADGNLVVREGRPGLVDAPPDVRAAGPDIDLSEREAEVVRLIALGYANKQIAARLRLSVKTVETYKARSMGKLKTRTRVGLVRYAIARGWMTAGEPTAAGHS